MHKKNVYSAVPLSLLVLLSSLLIFPSCRQGQKPSAVAREPAESLKKGVILVDYREKNKVDVYVDGDIFTSYIYPADLAKPVLFPVRSAEGTTVTRGFPLDPRKGERVDHPHHTGVWFTFGDVNGWDFWNSSLTAGMEDKNRNCRVLHRGVKRAESREDLGVLEIASDWQIPLEEGTWHTLLQEQAVYEFSGREHTRTIDRITRLTAQEEEVVFTDSKEGLFAIRVARELEHPSDKPAIFTDARGVPMKNEKVDNEGVNGQYLNSEGDAGTEAWGKTARWVSLSSSIGEEKITIAMFDHPENFGYPSHWHARDYGLFSVNNLGAKAFDGNADSIVFRLMPGESMVFKHRIHIRSGSHLDTGQLESIFEDFAGR